MLKLRTDGETIYAVGYWFGGTGNFEGVLAADPNTRQRQVARPTATVTPTTSPR